MTIRQKDADRPVLDGGGTFRSTGHMSSSRGSANHRIMRKTPYPVSYRGDYEFDTRQRP